MSEAKFTKGDWSFNPEVEVNDSMVIINDNSEVIVYLHNWSNFDGDGYANQLAEEEEANAHLIAAAPEMYAEIERDIAYLNRQMRFKTENDTMLPILIKERDRKIDLLAKARGEK